MQNYSTVDTGICQKKKIIIIIIIIKSKFGKKGKECFEKSYLDIYILQGQFNFLEK